MSKLTITITAADNEPDRSKLEETLSSLQKRLALIGYPDATFEYGAVADLAGIDFASDAGAELANDAGLSAEDFAGVKPSGKGGYTAADVRAVAGG